MVACDLKDGIGKNGKLPWHLKGELAYFQKVTTQTKDPHKQNMVIMGRTTWESIPVNNRPLKKRQNVILSRNRDYLASGATVCDSLSDALKLADATIEKIFIIGGATVFKEALETLSLDGIYLTRIDRDFDCDTFLSKIPACYSQKEVGSGKEQDISYHCYFLTF